MLTRVFICMPYGDHNTLEQREANTRKAMAVWHELADHGFLPYCPHLSHYLQEHRSRDRGEWLLHSLKWLAACDCAIVFGEVTEGMQLEIDKAHANGQPVFSMYGDLFSAYGRRRRISRNRG